MHLFCHVILQEISHFKLNFDACCPLISEHIASACFVPIAPAARCLLPVFSTSFCAVSQVLLVTLFFLAFWVDIELNGNLCQV